MTWRESLVTPHLMDLPDSYKLEHLGNHHFYLHA